MFSVRVLFLEFSLFSVEKLAKTIMKKEREKNIFFAD